MTNLQEGVLFLGLELVGTENFKTTCSFLIRETLLRALEKFKHVVNHKGFQVNLLLVVKVFGLELNLRRAKRSIFPHVRHVGGLGLP